MSIFHENKISEEKYKNCVRKVKEKSNVKKTKSAAKITGRSIKFSFEDEVKAYNKKNL